MKPTGIFAKAGSLRRKKAFETALPVVKVLLCKSKPCSRLQYYLLFNLRTHANQKSPRSADHGALQTISRLPHHALVVTRTCFIVPNEHYLCVRSRRYFREETLKRTSSTGRRVVPSPSVFFTSRSSTCPSLRSFPDATARPEGVMLDKKSKSSRRASQPLAMTPPMSNQETLPRSSSFLLAGLKAFRSLSPIRQRRKRDVIATRGASART